MDGFRIRDAPERFELGVGIRALVARGRAATFPHEDLMVLFQLAHFPVITARALGSRALPGGAVEVHWPPGSAHELLLPYSDLRRLTSTRAMYVLLVARLPRGATEGSRSPGKRPCVSSLLLGSGAVDLDPLLRGTVRPGRWEV